MMWFLVSVVAGLVVIAALCALAVAGFRDGDRPSDAWVAGVLVPAGQPDEARPVVIATVLNPSATPVMVGLTVRRSPWAPSVTARVPWRTSARRYRTEGLETVGIVLPGESATLRVPVRAAGRYYRLVAVVGQGERRLRVLTVPVTRSPVAEPSLTSRGR